MTTPHPSVATLRCFAAALTVLVLLTGWRCGLAPGPGLLIALGLGVVAAVRPRCLGPVYAGWLWLTFPLRWLVAHATLALLYFGLVTPLGLLRRGCQPRQVLTPESSYWVARPVATGDCVYFRQF